MKVHHLNCATLCPRVPSSLIGHSCLICHCLLIETEQGLILVDTGLGTQDIEHPSQRLGHILSKIVNPSLDRQEMALSHVEKLGHKKEDVRHIIMTHLDVDHAGGISDFPMAEVHILESEYSVAMNNRSKIEKLRYHHDHWKHRPNWNCHRTDGESWFNFQSVRALKENRLQSNRGYQATPNPSPIEGIDSNLVCSLFP